MKAFLLRKPLLWFLLLAGLVGSLPVYGQGGNDCGLEIEVNVENPTPPLFNNGAINGQIRGWRPSYQFNVALGGNQIPVSRPSAEGIFRLQDLSPGIYILEAFDPDRPRCRITRTVVVGPDRPDCEDFRIADIVTQPETIPPGNNGSVVFRIVGGTPPFVVSFGLQPPIETSNREVSFANLPSNTFPIVIRDSRPLPCVTTGEARVERVCEGVVEARILGLEGGPYCLSSTAPIPLTGLPTGGTFAGPGIRQLAPGIAEFIPANAGPGDHFIVYAGTNAQGCEYRAQVMVNVLQNCCPTPRTVTVVVESTTLARLTWESTGAPQYEVRFRPFGSPTWNPSQFAATNQFTLVLPAGVSNRWEVQVRSVCSTTGELSDWTAPQEFETGFEPCLPPTNVVAVPTGEFSALITWTAVANAANYRIEYRDRNSTTWQTIVVPALPTSAALGNLVRATTYFVRIFTLCRDGQVSPESEARTFRTEGTERCDPPAEVIIGDVGETTIALSWTAMPGSSQYQVRYRVRGQGLWTTQTTPATTFLIQGLSPGTEYEIEVITQCGSVVSDPSVTRNVTTADFQPKCLTPATVEVTNIAEDFARLNWSAVPNAQQYEIRYAERGSGNWIVRFSASSPFIMLNLKPRTRYEVQIKAICGPGFESERTPSTEFETPRSERCLAPVRTAVEDVSATTARVSWEPVANAVSYILRWRVKGSGSWTEQRDLTGTVADLADLRPRTVYEFQVAVVCDNDKTSNFTLSRDLETTELVCNAPATLTVSNLTTSEATVQWPEVPDARSYTIRWRTAPNGAFATAETPENQFRIINLQANTTYQVEVRTNCPAGVSSGFGRAEEFRTLALDPNCAVPADVSFSNITGTTAQVSWSAVTGAIRYTVEYRRITDLDWASVTTTTTEIVLENLQTSTRYLVRLRTECAGGSSREGRPSDFTTTGTGPSDCTGWTRTGSSEQQVRVDDVARGPGGRVAVAGSFTGSATFGTTTLSTAGQRDGFVGLLDANGQYLWARQIGGGLMDAATSVAISSTGDVYVAGYFMEECLFHTSRATALGTGTDAFLARFGATGNVEWVVQMGSANAIVSPDNDTINVVYDLTIGPDGNLYICGQYADECEFTSIGGAPKFVGDFNNIFTDAFVASYEPTGRLRWVQTGESPFIDAATALTTGSNGQVYVTGYYSVEADFSGTPLPIANPATPNVFAAKYTSDGVLLGVVGGVGTGAEIPTAIVVDNSEQAYIAGVFNQNFSSGSTTLNSRGRLDAFVAKLDAGGNGLWAMQIGGPNDDWVDALDFDADGNVVAAGYFPGSAQFGNAPARAAAGQIDSYLARFDRTNGQLIDVRTYGAPNAVVLALGYDFAPDGTEYLGGLFGGQVTISVDNVVGASGEGNGFVAKLCPAAVVEPCEPSDLVLATELTREGAKISWNPARNAALYIVRYRVEGQTNWTELEPVVASPLTLRGLTPKTTYELQIRTVCASGRESDFTTPEIFTTLGNCTAPAFIAADYTTATTADLYWARSPGARQYEVYYRVAIIGSQPKRLVVIDTFVTLRDLDPNNRWEFFVRAQCDVDEFAPDTPPAFFSTLTGACEGPPTNFRIIQVGVTTMTVAWSATFGAQSYEVSWRPVGTLRWVNVSTTGLQFLIGNLLPGTRYEVRVRANCGGLRNQSVWTRPQEATTDRLCPDAGPIRVTDSTGTTLTLAWDALPGVQSYEVYYRRKGDVQWLARTNITTNSVTLTGLNQITRYELALRTVCANGTRSPLGPIREAVTPLICQRPTSLTVDQVTSTSALVSWSPVRGALNYVLEYRSAESPTWTSLTVPGSRSSFTITGLFPDTEYGVRLRARCEQNTISDDLAGGFVTQVCGTPASIEIVSRTTSELLVRWSPVVGVVEYYLEYRMRGTDRWQRILVVEQTEYPISNLMPQTDYEVQVVANCITGSGQPSRRIIGTTTTGCNPPNLITSTTTSITATLNWVAMPGATGYWVYWRAPLFGEAYDSAFVNGTTLTIHNLRIGQRYEARIRTLCGNGPSAFSLFHDFVTDNFQGCRAPANFRAEPGLTSLRLNWTREPGALRYTIAYRRAQSFATWLSFNITDPATETFLIQNLIPDTDYEVRIRSVCNATVSEWALVAARTRTAARETLTEATAPSSWQLYPNPTRGPLTIQVPAAEGPVRLQLFDLRGREVFRSEMPAPAGTHAFAWPVQLPAGLEPALYLIRLERGQLETRLKLWVE